jgi:hypothetical protein
MCPFYQELRQISFFNNSVGYLHPAKCLCPNKECPDGETCPLKEGKLPEND